MERSKCELSVSIKCHSSTDVYSPFDGVLKKFTGKSAALTQGVPNFFFHLLTAFSILRAQGVPIGKTDYIRNFIGLE